MLPENITLSKQEIGTILAELYIIKNNLELAYRSVEKEEQKEHIIKKLIVIRKILGQDNFNSVE